MQQNGFTKQERERIKKLYETVLERIYTAHIKPFPDFPEPVFLISDAYPGVWLEHCLLYTSSQCQNQAGAGGRCQ